MSAAKAKPRGRQQPSLFDEPDELACLHAAGVTTDVDIEQETGPLCPSCGERAVPAWPRCCPVCVRAGWLAVERTSPPYIVTRELIEEAARQLAEGTD